MDRPRDAHLSRLRLAQPGAGKGMGLHPVDRHDTAADGRADVPADAGRVGQGDAGAGEVDVTKD